MNHKDHFANIRSQGHAHEKRVSCGSNKTPNKNKTLVNLKSKITPLETLAKVVLDKYKSDPIMRDEIIGKIEIYRINYTISKEFNNTKSQKELTRKLRNYLYELLKKEI